MNVACVYVRHFSGQLVIHISGIYNSSMNLVNMTVVIAKTCTNIIGGVYLKNLPQSPTWLLWLSQQWLSIVSIRKINDKPLSQSVQIASDKSYILHWCWCQNADLTQSPLLQWTSGIGRNRYEQNYMAYNSACMVICKYNAHAAGVYLTLRGATIGNNSYVDIDSIGISGQSDGDGLFCHYAGGKQRNWYYNNSIVENSTEVPISFVSILINNTAIQLLRTNKSRIGGQVYCIVDNKRLNAVIGKSQQTCYATRYYSLSTLLLYNSEYRHTLNHTSWINLWNTTRVFKFEMLTWAALHQLFDQECTSSTPKMVLWLNQQFCSWWYDV